MIIIIIIIKFFMNSHTVGVVLLGRRGLKENRAYLFISWILISWINFARKKIRDMSFHVDGRP